ncbi:Uncharacterized protein Fot_50805 [Forsythia ovata]|uniref:ADP/ATP translocase n=1 Tax=Forsythia ovata TaxID=205694 RepID=A0ABD1Q045_9LAMI
MQVSTYTSNSPLYTPNKKEPTKIQKKSRKLDSEHTENQEKRKAKDKLKKSMVVDNESGKSIESEVSTSSGMFLKKAQDSFFASFAIGWPVTNGAGLASYPIDAIRRRMMMTFGESVKYKSSMDAFAQILKNEGPKSLFKGVGANLLLVCLQVMTSSR